MSNYGRVRNARTGEILKRTLNRNGYLCAELWKGGRRKKRVVGGLVLEAFRCPRPPKHQASHIDGNRQNNRLENLMWETQVDNEKRKVGHGTKIRGSRIGTAKLDEKKVRAIKDEPDTPGGVLATRYGVSRSTIQSIRRGDTWAHITPTPKNLIRHLWESVLTRCRRGWQAIKER